MAKTSTSPRRPHSVWEFPRLTTSVHEYRKSKSPAPKIRKHYAAILAFIYRNRFVTSNQVQRRFGQFLKSDRTTRRHLAELQTLGFLETQPINSISPLLPKIFVVMAKGRRHLKAEFAKQGKSWEEAAYDRRRSTGQSFVHIWHEIAITEFLLSVWEATQAQPDWKLPILERRSLIKHPAFEISRSGYRRVVPDGLFLILHPKGRIISLLEIDTGTESQRQLEKKLESYRRWAESPIGQDYLRNLYRQAGAENPKPSFRLLFVVAPKVIGSEEARLTMLHQVVEEQPPSLQARIWSTSTAQLRTTQTSRLLNAPIWYRAGMGAGEFHTLKPTHSFFSF